MAGHERKTQLNYILFTLCVELNEGLHDNMYLKTWSLNEDNV